MEWPCFELNFGRKKIIVCSRTSTFQNCDEVIVQLSLFALEPNIQKDYGKLVGCQVMGLSNYRINLLLSV